MKHTNGSARRCLVTGGLGFLGSHLVDSLLDGGCRVTIVDSCISNVMQPSDYEGRCEVIAAPIEDLMEELSPRAHAHFDEIYHLAGVVGPAGVLVHAGNIAIRTLRATQAAVELGVAHKARVLEVSTSEVYGRDGTFSETDIVVVPARFTVRLEYAVAKLTSEIAALNLARVTDLWVNVVRPFDISGPRQLAHGGFVLPRFVIAALRGDPITVFGTGRQVRAFTDVRDTVAGLILALRAAQSGQIYNLGNPANEVNIEELARRVKAVARSSSEIIHVDPKEIFGPLFEDGMDKVPDHRKAESELGWRPGRALDSTIQDTLNWYREHPDLVVALPSIPRKEAPVG